MWYCVKSDFIKSPWPLSKQDLHLGWKILTLPGLATARETCFQTLFDILGHILRPFWHSIFTLWWIWNISLSDYSLSKRGLKWQTCSTSPTCWWSPLIPNYSHPNWPILLSSNNIGKMDKNWILSFQYLQPSGMMWTRLKYSRTKLLRIFFES